MKIAIILIRFVIFLDGRLQGSNRLVGHLYHSIGFLRFGVSKPPRRISRISFLGSPLLCGCCGVHKCCFWLLLISTFLPRIGEASNPGPDFLGHDHSKPSAGSSDFLRVGACNPTQLLGKEEICESWGQGIWTYAETSVTPKAAPAIRGRFKKFGSSIIFGEHVKPQTSSTLFRGRAGGVAISSGFPVRSHLYPQPDWLVKSTRFVDAVVHVQGHLPIYVSSIYGVAGKCSSHPMELTEDILNQAANRAVKYKGPALICGDFNTDISSMQAWKNLEMQGWYDLALLDSRIYDRQAQSHLKIRKSPFLHSS